MTIGYQISFWNNSKFSFSQPDKFPQSFNEQIENYYLPFNPEPPFYGLCYFDTAKNALKETKFLDYVFDLVIELRKDNPFSSFYDYDLDDIKDFLNFKLYEIIDLGDSIKYQNEIYTNNLKINRRIVDPKEMMNLLGFSVKLLNKKDQEKIYKISFEDGYFIFICINDYDQVVWFKTSNNHEVKFHFYDNEEQESYIGFSYNCGYNEDYKGNWNFSFGLQTCCKVDHYENYTQYSYSNLRNINLISLKDEEVLSIFDKNIFFNEKCYFVKNNIIKYETIYPNNLELNYTSEYNYDSNNREISFNDSNGQFVKTEYSKSGLVLTKQDSISNVFIKNYYLFNTLFKQRINNRTLKASLKTFLKMLFFSKIRSKLYG